MESIKTMLVVLIFLLMIAAAIYVSGQNMETVIVAPGVAYPFINSDIKDKNRKKKKKVKFGNRVERRDYDKESGDIVDKMTVKINDS